MSKESQIQSKLTFFLHKPDNRDRALKYLKDIKQKLSLSKQILIKVSDTPVTFIEKTIDNEGNIKIGKLKLKFEDINNKINLIRKELELNQKNNL